MTEEEAQTWLCDKFGSTAFDRLSIFHDLVLAEASQQNLISPSTISAIWARHIADSAQLVLLAPLTGEWVDVGTGAGFPGMVVAILRLEQTHLVEPRKRRAEFLANAARELGISSVIIHMANVQTLSLPAAVISARAVAPIEKLLHAAAACATTETRWLLPRGRMETEEMDAIRSNWRGVFHMEQSLTDPWSTIVVANQVAPR